MTTLMTDARAARSERWRAPSRPKTNLGLAAAGLAVAVLVIAATAAVLQMIGAALETAGLSSGPVEIAVIVVGLASVALLVPAWRAVRAARRAAASADVVAARTAGAEAGNLAWIAIGYSVTALLIDGLGLFVVANNSAVTHTFFNMDLIISSFGLVGSAFWTNVFIFLVAEVLVLVWGLVIAVARIAPGDAWKPIRVVATAYTDVFRGLPAIITIYLVGFGLPLTGLPLVSNLPQAWYAILALTLTYGAYVAEVYRAGIESIHQSQTAASRSLGLSYAQTLRYVVVPQAVRRIIPPLLNDFISLQKDTALVNVIGAIDAFNQAKIVASNHFNLSSVTTVAFLFVVITIPQARFVDRQIAKDQARTRAG